MLRRMYEFSFLIPPYWLVFPVLIEILSKDFSITFLSSHVGREMTRRDDFYFSGNGSISLTVVPWPTWL
jgi:hypothetical protein